MAIHYYDDYHLGVLGISKVKTKVVKTTKTKVVESEVPVMGVSNAAEVIEGE